MRQRTYEEALTAREDAFRSPELVEIGHALGRAGVSPASLEALVRATARRSEDPAAWERLRQICAPTGVPQETRALERYVLLSASFGLLQRTAQLPVDSEVKGLIYDEYCFVAQPHRRWMNLLQPGTHGFAATCRLLRHERFPAGQLHWEVSGFPRSWLRLVPSAELPRVLLFLLRDMKGFRPYFESHLATRWTQPFTLREDEDIKACLRIARSMALQPAVRGYFSSSWLNDPTLIEISPHLGWRFEKAKFGALFTTAGLAPDNSGVLTGSVERQALHQSGSWKPRIGVVLWPRRSMIDWASRHQRTSASAAVA